MDRDRLVSLQRWFDHSQTIHALEFCSIGSCPKLPNPRFGVATLMDVNRWRGVDLLSKDSNPVPNLARPAPADIDAYIRAEDAAFKGRNPLVCSAGHARSNGDDEKLAIWQDVILGSVSDQVVDEFSKKAREAYEAWTGDYAPFVWQWLDLIRPLSVVNRFVFVVWRDAQRLDVTTGMLLVDVEETIQRTREQLAPDGIEICRIPVERWDGGLCLASSLAIAGKLRNSAVVAAIADIADRIDQIFRQSGLMTDKWGRPDYRAATIDTALSGCRNFYDWTRGNGAAAAAEDSATEKSAGMRRHTIADLTLPPDKPRTTAAKIVVPVDFVRQGDPAPATPEP